MLRLRDTAEAAAERAAVAAGRLPSRYAEPWEAGFLGRVDSALHEGVRILDVGSGARPVIAKADRPRGCAYTGLDVSRSELERAGADTYDEVVVGDVCTPQPRLAGRFDLVVSWQVLEHVASMRTALCTQRTALASGGRLIAMLSGAWSVYALAARVVPYRVSTRLQARLLGSDERDKFPVTYDGCSARALGRLFAEGGWSEWQIEPRYKAGGYLRFSRPLQRIYLAYENWAERSARANLATHYVIEAVA